MPDPILVRELADEILLSGADPASRITVLHHLAAHEQTADLPEEDIEELADAVEDAIAIAEVTITRPGTHTAAAPAPQRATVRLVVTDHPAPGHNQLETKPMPRTDADNLAAEAEALGIPTAVHPA